MNIIEKKFKVAVYDSEEFIIFMNKFNESHKTDFIVEGTDFWDGVEFVFVSFDDATLEEVFLLGSEYQGSHLRERDRHQTVIENCLNRHIRTFSKQSNLSYWKIPVW